MNIEKYLELAVDMALELGKNIIIALIIYYIGKKLIRWVLKLVNKSLEKGKVEPIVAKFTVSIIKCILYVVMLIVIIGILGIPTTSFIAIFSTASLTVGLALQGSLSNFAGGVLILLFKPFRVGDYIIACGNEGSVSGIDMFYTKLMTVDNKVVVIPNGTLANTSLTNVTAERYRRVDVQVGISYDSDMKKAKEVLTEVIDREDRILKDKGVNVFVAGLDASQVTMETRVWVEASDYWNVKWQLLEQYKLKLDENGIEIPFNQLSVTVKSDKE